MGVVQGHTVYLIAKNCDFITYEMIRARGALGYYAVPGLSRGSVIQKIINTV